MLSRCSIVLEIRVVQAFVVNSHVSAAVGLLLEMLHRFKAVQVRRVSCLPERDRCCLIRTFLCTSPRYQLFTPPASTMPWREADYPRTLHVVNLRKTSAWVRDTLDPLMARDGPSELHPDDVLTLHDIFLALQHHQISLATMQFSRIHLAVSEVCGKATRWPTKLADEADRVIRCLESCYGPLETIQTPLYEVGGRLHGISEPRHLTRDVSWTF